MKKNRSEEIIVGINAIFIKLIGRTRLPFVGQGSSQIYTNNNFKLRIITVYARNLYRRVRQCLSSEGDPAGGSQSDSVGSGISMIEKSRIMNLELRLMNDKIMRTTRKRLFCLSGC